MVTVVNTPSPENNDDNMWGFLGVLLIVVTLFALFYYGLPRLRSVSTTPQINVPENIDIDINQTE